MSENMMMWGMYNWCPIDRYRWEQFTKIRKAIDENEGGLQKFAQGRMADFVSEVTQELHPC